MQKDPATDGESQKHGADCPVKHVPDTRIHHIPSTSGQTHSQEPSQPGSGGGGPTDPQGVTTVSQGSRSPGGTQPVQINPLGRTKPTLQPPSITIIPSPETGMFFHTQPGPQLSGSGVVVVVIVVEEVVPVPVVVVVGSGGQTISGVLGSTL